jgi:polysaccharide pyruvyl transferase WcaK-like protein
MPKKYNLLITGYYFKKNYGDDLLLKVAKKLFSPRYCSTEFSTQVIAIDAINQNNLTDLCTWSDKIILFGGEVLNDYFIGKLNSMKSFAIQNLRKNIGMYAIGVSCNSDYAYITNKLDIFEVIIFRNQADSDMFTPRYSNLYCKMLPDPVFLLKPENKPNFLTKFSKKEKNINVGFFLSQTVKATDEYIENLAHLVRNWIFHNATVYFLTMCNNLDSSTENDLILNTAVYNKLNYAEREHVVYMDKPESILDLMPSLQYAVCWRFHAHVFCIQYGVPFISISNTPKVINLLKDTGLGDLCFYNRNTILGISYVIDNCNELKKKLDGIHSSLLKSAQDYKKWPIFIFRERHLPRFALDVNNSKLFQNINKWYTQYAINSNHDHNSKILIYLLTGRHNSEYQWGLMKKMESLNMTELAHIENEVRWLITEQIKLGTYPFFYKMAHYNEIDGCLFEKQSGKFLNIHYIDQNDMRGVHRSGWQYVIDGIERELTTFHPAAILCDLYLDRTFHWNYEINTALNIIPYTRSWIGFIHHTVQVSYSNYNVIEMFKKENFIKSLSNCRALIVLSSYLKIQIQAILKKMGISSIYVFQLYHPTEFVDASKCFDYNKFITMPTKKIVQVGAWMREIGAIFKLSMGTNPLKYNRYALKGPNMESYYKEKGQTKEQISRDKTVRFEGTTKSIVFALERPVEILDKLASDEYDELFKTSIIFIKLVDASAVNTVIESIVRNTPILVNPLDAVVEYLGKDYPFYYKTLEEATAKANDQYVIRKTYFYLKKMDKTNLRLDIFLQNFRALKIFQSVLNKN